MLHPDPLAFIRTGNITNLPPTVSVHRLLYSPYLTHLSNQPSSPIHTHPLPVLHAHRQSVDSEPGASPVPHTGIVRSQSPPSTNYRDLYKQIKTTRTTGVRRYIPASPTQASSTLLDYLRPEVSKVRRNDSSKIKKGYLQ